MNNPLIRVIKDIESSIEKGAAVILDSVEKVECDVIPTGIEKFDSIIGIGGFPRGRITEIYGLEGSGKTTFCLHAIAQANKMGMKAGIIDTEHAIDIHRAETIGIERSKVILAQPKNGEEALQIAEMMIISGEIAIVVIDSVAALTPKNEIDKDFGDAPMGSQARLMGQGMRKLVAINGRNNVALIFTNQLRAKLGGFFPSDTTTGGNALKYYSSLRIQLKRMGQTEDPFGHKLASKYKAYIVKNKLAVPFKDMEYCVGAEGIYIPVGKRKLKDEE